MDLETRLLFWRYSFQAMDACTDKTDEEKSKYKKMILRKEAPDLEETENLFPAAFRRIYGEKGKRPLSYDDVEWYWHVGHNEAIENKEGGYGAISSDNWDACKVKFWKVKDVLDKGSILLENERWGDMRSYNLWEMDLEKGSYVSTHENLISQKVSLEVFEKHG